MSNASIVIELFANNMVNIELIFFIHILKLHNIVKLKWIYVDSEIRNIMDVFDDPIYLVGYTLFILPRKEKKNCFNLHYVGFLVEADVSKATLSRTQVLECASESDSDMEPANLETVWKASNDDSSDAESIDSSMEDPLR